MHESHEYFESQEKFDCFKNISTLHAAAVSGSWSSFHNLIILPLIPGYYPYLEIIIHFLNYCRLVLVRFSPGNLESVIDQNFDR